MERSPKAVSAAATRAVAPPKFQIEDSVLGDGGPRSPRGSARSPPSLRRQVVALPVAAVLAERHEGVEELLDVAVVHLAGEVGDRFAELPQRLEQALALGGVAGVDRGEGVDPLAPVLLGVVGIGGDRRELDDPGDVVAPVGEKVAPEADRPAARLERDRAARRTSPSVRRDAARTRTPSRRRNCHRRP